MDSEESKEISDNKLQKPECSMKKSVKPLIEVISEYPIISKEQTSKQTGIEEQSHSSQTIFHYQQIDVSIIYNSIIYIKKKINALYL